MIGAEGGGAGQGGGERALEAALEAVINCMVGTAAAPMWMVCHDREIKTYPSEMPTCDFAFW